MTNSRSILDQFNMTEDEYAHANDNMFGFCRACGDQADNVEPDAEKYPCAACGERQVYGAEQLMIRGQINFIDWPEAP